MLCVWVCVYKGRESQRNVAIGLVNQPDTSHGPSYMHAATISTPVYARNGVCRLSKCEYGDEIVNVVIRKIGNVVVMS